MGINLKKLNPSQRAAVEAPDGPVLVVAGAGTGKTRTIAYRTARLISRGVAPENILSITFTNKAARSMRERISGLIGSDTAALATICTIHSLCARMLRESMAALGRSEDFSIFDTSDQLGLLRTAMTENGMDPRKTDPRSLLFRFSGAKNSAEPPDTVFSDRREVKIFNRYNKLLEQNNALDFDDLLLFANRLVAESAEARELYRDRFRHIMVDEYQDVNGVQYELLRGLAGAHRNIYVVGDEDQSIYGWRGARMEHILNFEKDFKGARIFKLQQNYRSTREILDAANRLIRNNTSRRDKQLIAVRGPGFPVRVLAAASDRDEAASLIERIITEKHKAHLRFSDFAVLFRTNAQSRLFEEALIHRNIAYVLVGGTKFYERREIKHTLAYLRFAANPQDSAALERILNYPARGIGARSQDIVFAYAAERTMPPGFVLEDEEMRAQLSDRARAGLDEFVKIMNNFRERSSKRPIADAVRRLVEDIKFEQTLKKAYENANEAKHRYENVMEMVSSVADYEANTKQASLAGFLENASLLTDERESDDDLREDTVALMTMHAGKGLEFTVVFVVGVEEGILPHERSADTPEEIEEERRLFYVGMTRAMKRLFISYANTRRRAGETVQRKQSRFLNEITGPGVEWDDPGELKRESADVYKDIATDHIERIRNMFK